MPDGARSDHPGVQRQLDRLAALSPGADVLGLDRIGRLLSRLGEPQRAMPPAFHVAGTNGKGSTCAFLRAALEAAGYRVHAFTSPHLVRFNERIRLAGRLIGDDALAALLAEVLDASDGIGPSFFEVTTAAAFLAFARVPADACIVEVGLGGRLDATNLVRPLVTGIAQLGVDHQAFLGDTPEAIAAEKAGIAKAGVPLVTMRYPPSVSARVAAVAAAATAPVLADGVGWHWSADTTGVAVRDGRGALSLPWPALPGAHQAANLSLAVAMLRAQSALDVPDRALVAAARRADWPARMQRLDPVGPLARLLPAGAELRVDGGHNEAAARAVADTVATLADGRATTLVLGVLANKDAAGLLAPLAARDRAVITVPVLGHEHHDPNALAALARSLGFASGACARDLSSALAAVDAARPPFVLILGSLYLAGIALAANAEPPS